MARMQGLILALTLSSVAAQRVPLVGGCIASSAADCCKYTDARPDPKFNGQECVPAIAGGSFFSGQVCEPKCLVDGTKCKNDAQDPGEGLATASDKMGTCAAPTTTMTPWDSSESSDSSSEDSKSLESSCSSSFRKPWESSTSSTDSSTDSSGSTASGSSGCYPSLPVWPFIICPLIPLCLAPLIPLCQPKPKPPKKKPAPKPEPQPEPVPELILPSMQIPVPSYSMVAPISYQQPVSYQQVAAPVMQAAPIMTTAAPMTTAYETVAAPMMQAAPLLGTTSYSGYSGTTAYPAGGVY